MSSNSGYSILIHNLRSFKRVLIVSSGGPGAAFLAATAKAVLGDGNAVVVAGTGKDKNRLFRESARAARKRKMVLCGTADLSDAIARPNGRKIEAEWGVFSPLTMAGITRREARAFSRGIVNPVDKGAPN